MSYYFLRARNEQDGRLRVSFLSLFTLACSPFWGDAYVLAQPSAQAILMGAIL